MDINKKIVNLLFLLSFLIVPMVFAMQEPADIRILVQITNSTDDGIDVLFDHKDLGITRYEVIRPRQVQHRSSFDYLFVIADNSPINIITRAGAFAITREDSSLVVRKRGEPWIEMQRVPLVMEIKAIVNKDGSVSLVNKPDNNKGKANTQRF